MSSFVLLIALGALLLVFYLLRTGRRRRLNQRRRHDENAAHAAPLPTASTVTPIVTSPSEWSYDAADQLRTVMNASFTKRRLMSRDEYKVFRWVEQAIRAQKLPWLVMAQVSLGEILSSHDEDAYYAINSKRVDILVVTKAGDPVAALEFQGGGHSQGTAAARDAIKKEALRRAGVGYIEVTPQDGAEDVTREIKRLASSPGG